MKAKCIICGREYEKTTPSLCCSKPCRKENDRRRREKNKELEKIPEKKPRQKVSLDYLSEINEEARKLGLSYGQYKAKLYLERGF